MDKQSYYKHLEGKEGVFENICRRCGKCCGADDDPCEKLQQLSDGTYFCSDYSNRLGLQRTVSGKTFHCVSIREHIAADTLHPECGYRACC